MNRLTKGVELYEKAIKDKNIPQAKLDALALADDDYEVIKYQQLQAEAFAMGKLNAEEAQWLYHELGRELPTKEHFNSLPPAVRMVVMKTMEELLSSRLKVK
jgi:hypothetical protein